MSRFSFAAEIGIVVLKRLKIDLISLVCSFSLIQYWIYRIKAAMGP